MQVQVQEFLTLALDGRGQLHTPAALPLGSQAIEQMAWWVPEPNWKQWKEKNSCLCRK